MKKSFLLLLVLAMLCPIAACSSGSGTAETQAPITEGAPAETNVPETAEPKTNPYENLPATPAEIDALIASIPGAEIENVNDIDRAYLAYWRLSEDDRAAVSGYEALQTLRSDLKKKYVIKEYHDTRVPHDRFLIGTYAFRDFVDDAHLKQMVDADVDFIWSGLANDETMPLFEKYGVGFVSRYSFWRGDFDDNNLKDGPTNPITAEDAAAIVESVNPPDFPSMWCFDLGDEPAQPEFPYLGLMADAMKPKLPAPAVIVNLFPNYANAAGQLGSLNYRTYIDSFVNNVESDIICFDHYCQSDTITVETVLRQFQIVGDAAVSSGRDFWYIAQDFQWSNTPPVTADFLRYQAYIAMAYGCKSVVWACWSETNWGKKGTDVLDANGDPNPVYYELATVNAELKALEPIYMRYTGASNAILLGENAGFDNTMKRYARDENVGTLTQTSLSDITGSDNALIAVGHFTKNVGDGEAFLLVDSTDKLYREEKSPAVVTFRTVDPSSVVVAYVRGIPTLLEPDETGVYTVEIRGADAVFVTVD